MENCFLRPFDNVVNCNEDFQSNSEVSGKIDASAVATNNCEVEPVSLKKKNSITTTRRTKPTLTIFKVRGTALQKPLQRTRSKSRTSSRRHRQSLSAEPQSYRSKHHCQFPLIGSNYLNGKNSTPPEKERSQTTTLFSEYEKLEESSLKARFSPGSNNRQLLHGSPKPLDNLLQRFLEPNSKEAIQSRLISLRASNKGTCTEISTIQHSAKFAMDPTGEHLINLASHFQTQDNIFTGTQLSIQGKRSSVSLSDLRKRVSSSVLEEEVNELRWRLAYQSVEAEKVAAELAAVRRAEREIRTQLTDLSRTGSVKADTVSCLTTKIAELYADIESLRCAHSHAVDHQTDLQAEVASLKRSRDWYSDQLRAKQADHDRIEEDLKRLRGLLKESNEVNHRLTHENACLQAQLACTRAELADAKRNLSQQLESIRVDMIEREVIFERIASERAGLEKMNVQRSGEVGDLQQEIFQLKNELSATDEQVARQRARLEQLEEALSTAETRRSELQEMLQSIECQHQIQEGQLNEKIAQHTDALARINALESECERQAGLLITTMEERDTTVSALEAAQKEKDTLNAYLCTLKDSMTKIEESFDKLRHELETKSAQLLEVTEQRNHLVAQLEAAQARLDDAYRLIEQLKGDKVLMNADFQQMKATNGQAYTPVPGLSVSLSDTAVQTSEPQCCTQARFQLVNQPALYAGNQFAADVSQAGLSEYTTVPPINSSDPSLLFSKDPLEQTTPELHMEQQSVSREIQTSGDKTLANQQVTSKLIHINASISYGDRDLESVPPAPATVIQVNSKTSEPTILTTAVAVRSDIEKHVCSEAHHHIVSLQQFSEAPPLSDDEPKKKAPTGLGSPRGQLLLSVSPESGTVGHGSLSVPTVDISDQTESLEPLRAELLSDEVSDSVAEQRTISAYFGSIPPTSTISKGQPQFNREGAAEIHSAELELLDVAEHKAVLSHSSVTGTEQPDISVSSHSTFNGSNIMMSPGPRPTFQSDQVVEANYLNGLSSLGGMIPSRKFDCQAAYIRDLEEAQVSLQKALLDSRRDTEEAIAKLKVALREIEMHSNVAQNEAAARQKLIKTHQETNTELENVTSRLRDIELEAETLRHEVKRLQNQIQQLEDGQETLSSARANELSTMRIIIKTITKHLTTMNLELKQAQREKIICQTEYARLRGSIRAQVERFRLFTRLEPTLQMKLPVGESAQSVVERLSALGIDVESLENLLGDSSDIPLIRSKPIEGLEKCFETLQTEIDQLEDQVLQHVSTVAESAKNWSSLKDLNHIPSEPEC